jgi:Tfp pilus assembly protein PilV
MKSAGQRQGANRTIQGFSLVEAMVAIAVLTVGVLGLARLVPFATRTDYGARTDSTATFIAMREMEQIVAQPWTTTTFQDAADDAGASTNVNLACTCATPPCTGSAGSSLTGDGVINFNAAAVAGYNRAYTINQTTAAGAVKVSQGRYDLRWRIDCNIYTTGAGLKSIIVAARPVGNVPGIISLPAQVRAVKMR